MMDESGCSSSSGSFSEEEIDSGVVTGQKKYCIRFTQAQRACLLKVLVQRPDWLWEVLWATNLQSCTELLDYSVLAYWVPLY